MPMTSGTPVRTVAMALAGVLTFAARGAVAEPKHVCIAAADRGQQLRDDGKYRAARDAFVECAREACPAVIAKSCMTWLGDLDKALPTVVVAARDGEGRDVADARVLLDDVPAAERLDGMPLSIDPGEHVVRVEREGSQPVEVRVVMRAGEKGRAVVVTLVPLVAAQENAASRESAPARASASEAARTSSRSLLTARNVTAASLLGAAVASTVAAIVLAADSRDAEHAAAGYRDASPSNACVGSTSSTCSAWSDAVDTQNRDAIASRVFFGAAGVLAAGSVVTYLLWPRAAEAAPSVSLTRGGGAIGVRGSF